MRLPPASPAYPPPSACHAAASLNMNEPTKDAPRAAGPRESCSCEMADGRRKPACIRVRTRPARRSKRTFRPRVETVRSMRKRSSERSSERTSERTSERRCARSLAQRFMCAQRARLRRAHRNPMPPTGTDRPRPARRRTRTTQPSSKRSPYGRRTGASTAIVNIETSTKNARFGIGTNCYRNFDEDDTRHTALSHFYFNHAI